MVLSLRSAISSGIITPILCMALGCGQRGERLHVGQGFVELSDGDVAVLVGSHVELALQSDMKIRASGTIRADGAFTLETNQAGVIHQGVREGVYHARLILTDDERAAFKIAKNAVAARFLDFQTSGWSVRIPASGTILLTAAKK